jgi:signal transduction histidine kinase/ActR/RegA family two-component response regulator
VSGGFLGRRLRAVADAAAVADYDWLRRLFFFPVLVISAIAAFTVAAGLHDDLLAPSMVRTVRSVVAVWVVLHLPIAMLSRGPNATVAYEVFGYLAFGILTLIFQNTYTSSFGRVLAQIPLNYTLLFVILLLLPLSRYLVFVSAVCTGTVIWTIAVRKGFALPHELGAALSVSGQVAAQWAVCFLLGTLLEWHRRHLMETRQELARLNVRLQQEVADQTRTIRIQQEGIARAEKLQAIGVLAGGIAHDFNNKLTVVLGYCDMLARRHEKDTVSARWLEEVSTTANQASVMTRQLLSFGRRELVRPKVLDLSACVSARRDMIERLVGARVSLVIEADPAAGNVLIDPGQADQILMNLVLNARDAMPAGGRLTIRIARSLRPGGFALLSVGDTGIGMDATVRSHLFEPFFTTKDPGSGTGLGLASVYGIVKQNGGDIEVRSETGQGSVFEIRLPLTDAPAEGTPEHRTTAALADTAATILLVEDEPRLQSLIREVLEGHGFLVLAAADGDGILALCRAHAGPIDLLLSDIVTPGRHVSEVVGEIRRTHPSIRMIFMSGYPDDSARELGLLDGSATFLPKPFTPSGLLAHLREVLRRTPGR